MDAQLQQIIVGCKKGQLSAQKTLFDRFRPRLFGVCLRYAHDRPEAQDMLQEAFLAIFRDLHQYTGQGSFEGWMQRVTVRAALQQLRKRNPLRFASDFDDLAPESSFSWPDTDRTQEAILACVQQLPIGYRTVFNLRCLESYEYTEIATELGIAESSVRSQYARACQQLRGLVNQLLISEH